MATLAALDDATIEAAGMLVASEHTAARRAHPSLPVAWTDPQVCTGALRRLLDTGHRGAVAIEGDRALAVLTGTGRGTPPIYSPGGTQSVEALVAEHLALREAGATHLVAALDGRDVGLLTIELTSPAPRLCPEGQPYVGPTATLAAARGQGVGRALVDTALTWAHAQGYEWVSVDFESANPLSRLFWLGNGFRPTGYCVVRVIQPPDQRGG